jgi:hypothetical protein
MSSSRRVRPSTAVQSQVQKGRFDYSEAGRLSSDRVKKLLGENCTLGNSQLEELTDGLCAFADFVVTVFAEQREQRKTAVSEQPMPMPATPAPVFAVV